MLRPKHMHIFRPRQKHLRSFKTIRVKMLEELRSQDTQCLYASVEVEPKLTKFKLQKLT